MNCGRIVGLPSRPQRERSAILSAVELANHRPVGTPPVRYADLFISKTPQGDIVVEGSKPTTHFPGPVLHTGNIAETVLFVEQHTA